MKETAMEVKLGDGDTVRIGPVGSSTTTPATTVVTSGVAKEVKNVGSGGKGGAGKNKKNSTKGSGKDDDDWDDGWGDNMQLDLEEMIGGEQLLQELGQSGGDLRQRPGKGAK